MPDEAAFSGPARLSNPLILPKPYEISGLDLLPSLFEEILIPAQVAAETAASVQPRSWIRKQSLSLPLLQAVQRPTLGPGEGKGDPWRLKSRPAPFSWMRIPAKSTSDSNRKAPPIPGE